MKLKEFPKKYIWILQRGIVGRSAFTGMNPWYFVADCDLLFFKEIDISGEINRIAIFARRQDNDILAGFVIDDDVIKDEIFVVQGWTPEGFICLKKFPDIFEWLKMVIDDIRDQCIFT